MGDFSDTYLVVSRDTRLRWWRRTNTCYAPCVHSFMAAIALAAAVIFWLP